MLPKNWLLNEKFVPEVLAAVDECLANPGWDSGVTLDATENKSLQLLLVALNELAKRGMTLRARVETVIMSGLCTLETENKLLLATEDYDGEEK